LKKASDIFTPGALPNSTYIIRKTFLGFTYEERLIQALNMKGYLTFISGPSKMGKTVLCEKVIGIDRLVEVSGSDFSDKDRLWIEIGAKAGMPLSGLYTSTHQDNSSMSEEYFITRDNVIQYYLEHDKVLLLDDFHYADIDMQKYIAQQFKDAIRKGFKVVISSLPHRSDDAIRTNPDLQGRISIIDIEQWNKEELSEIPRRGFNELGVNTSEVIINRIVDESLSSPQLVQLICLNLCVLAKLDTDNKIDIDEDMIEKAFKFSTLNLDYQNVANVIRQGKNQRGKMRKMYHTHTMGDMDLYELIIEAIADNPPVGSVTFEQLLERIEKIVLDEMPTSKSVRDYLNSIQEIIQQRGHAFEVIEWKDDTVYILEALFLFYMRWGR
jgi:hypothetical protein